MKHAHFRILADGTVSYQSVRAHLEGTAVLSERFAAKVRMPKTGRLLGLLHDAGKLGEAYQNYLLACEQYELGKAKEPPRRGSVDHGAFGGVYVMKEFWNQEDSYSGLTAEILAMVTAYHHGGLKDYVGLDASTPLWDRLDHYYENRREEYESIKDVFEKEFPGDEIKALFLESVSEVRTFKQSLPRGIHLHFQLHLLIKYLYSCLIDADREDTRRLMEGVEDVRKETCNWAVYEKRLEDYLHQLHRKTPEGSLEREIKALREEISSACLGAGSWPAGVYKLTVPTGGGKNLASMRMALRHMRTREHSDSGHIIQVLPYTTIIEQNAQAIRNVLRCQDELLEHHSNVILERPGEEEHNLSEEKYRLLTERWSSPFLFTTTVQFLNTVYGAGTQDVRRMHNLANSVIIMDEVQALPLDTMCLFGELVNFLYYICNTTILFCTATQPDLDRQSIGMKPEVREIIPDVTEKFQRFQRMKVEDRLLDGGYSIEDAASFIERRKQKVTSLLVVMNTKPLTRALYDSLKRRMEGQAEVLYITTELCPAHRRDVIRHLKDLLEQKEPVICVSTSVLEAGVDVSFEGVIRNLAGLDSIAQSSGRGNRHGENEQMGITSIINMKDEQLGSMTQIVIGEEKTRAVLDTYRRRPEVYDHSLLSPAALSDYFEKYFKAGDIESRMKYPLKGDSELKNLYSYFSGTGAHVLKRRYEGKGRNYRWNLTFPFGTAGEKFQVIREDTVSVLVPYGKGKDIIQQLVSLGKRGSLGELDNLMKEARPYFVNLYTSKLPVFQQAVVSSPVPGILILRDGYYDDITGIKDQQTLEFLSY